MSTSTLVLLLLSVLVAAGLSYFQYFYKATNSSKRNALLALLRFLGILGILVLLINPVISRKTYETEKTPLAIVTDNSRSITELSANKQAVALFEKLSDDSRLKDKFDIQLYKFDAEVNAVENKEELNFKGNQTRIDKVAKNTNSINRNRSFPTVLISDGNQTSGEDYVFTFPAKNKVYPLVLGDTATYLDLKINQINVNKYAFHKNKFPVEVFLQYAGNKSVSGTFSVSQGNTVLHSQAVSFSPTQKALIVNLLLPAERVGMQLYTAKISTAEKEKNTYNNTKKFAVDIIDQRSEVALISSINHPDLGALKRSIESNASRKVTILKPNGISDLDKYNLLILYQPNTEFKSLFEANKNKRLNYWIITGNATDFNLLNQVQANLSFRVSSQKEDYTASYANNFNLFALDNIGFEGFPPLENPYGSITANANVSVLLNSRIRTVDTESPLMAFSDNQGLRSAFLCGENLWKWRANSFVAKKSFTEFDIFIDKVIQFLASNDSRKSLVVNHERFYNSGDALEITAQYFNKNYELDEKARLTITVTNTKTKQIKRYDMLRASNAFKVNLDGLSAGQYTFTVKELNSNSTYSAGFEIIDFDIEKQFVNPDMTRLRQLASQTAGQVYTPNQTEALIKTLLDNQDYRTVEKAIVKRTPLVDWIWLLVLIAAIFGAEWFIRKYYGLL